jgi:ankyrin repeat protein
LDACNDEGETPLHIAVHWRMRPEHTELLHSLMTPTNVRMRDVRGHTPLHRFMECNEYLLMQYCTQEVKRFNNNSAANEAPLHPLLRHLNLLINKSTLEELSLKQKIRGKYVSALHYLVCSDRADAVELAVGHLGCDVLAHQWPSGLAGLQQSPGNLLMSAIRSSEPAVSVDTMRPLMLPQLLNPPPPADDDAIENRPLCIAIFSQRWDVAVALVEHGADITARSNNLGADITSNNRGACPFDYAYSFISCRVTTPSLRLLEVLLSPEVMRSSRRANTALSRACKKEAWGWVRVLLRAGHRHVCRLQTLCALTVREEIARQHGRCPEFGLLKAPQVEHRYRNTAIDLSFLRLPKSIEKILMLGSWLGEDTVQEA